jgi:hypothetical protein
MDSSARQDSAIRRPPLTLSPSAMRCSRMDPGQPPRLRAAQPRVQTDDFPHSTATRLLCYTEFVS